MTRHRLLQEVVNWWAMHPCPRCGEESNPVWLIILDTYSVSCRGCGTLLDSFEVYYDQWPHAHLRAHYRAS
jgi:hypothetical protein